MARPAPFHSMVGRDPQVARMVGVSALLHGAVLFLVLFVVPLVKPRPLPLVAYTVELTDPNALGGRLAPGRTDLPPGPRPGAGPSAEAPAKQGEPAPAPRPEPVAKAEPPAPAPPPKPVERAPAPEPPKPVEAPKPAEPVAKLPSLEKPPPKPEAKKPPEPKPEPQPKPEAKKPEPPKPEPKPVQAKPEPPKTETKPEAKPEPKPATATATKPAEAKPAAATKPADAKPAEAKPVGKPNGRSDGAEEGTADAYASAAQKWRAHGATGGGGGLGGTDTASGPLGTPGYGAGGGQVVGFEFLAYQQRVVSTVKSVWTNAVPRPGLVAKVRFQIAPNGEVSGVRMEQSSGDVAFDGSALRAVQRANPLPPPPARYVNEFREFIIEFHSEEGGQAAG